MLSRMGPQSAVARMLNTHRRNVWWWLHKGPPDKEWRPKMVEAAEKLNIPLDPQFRSTFLA